MRYPVVIHKDNDSDYGVTIPDIPGCYSAGATYDEALSNTIEAIECHIEGLLLDNESVPIGTHIDTWIRNDEFKGGIWALLDIDLSQITGKVKRVNITLPERVLQLIDLYGKNHAIKNRSAFLTDAALNYIAQNQ